MNKVLSAAEDYFPGEIERRHTPEAKAQVDFIGVIAKAKALAYLEAKTRTTAERLSAAARELISEATSKALTPA